MFLFIKTPGFVFTTDAEPQDLLSAEKSPSSCHMADQANLAAYTLEIDTEGKNAVKRLCFLEARKISATTGKICVYSLPVAVKGSNTNIQSTSI